MGWITAPDVNVTIDESAYGSVGTYSHLAGVFTADSTRATAIGGLAAPASNYFRVELPTGYAYTGNTRLTVTSNDAAGPYDQFVFTQASAPPFSGNPVGSGPFLDDLGAIASGDFIYVPAGTDDGSPFDTVVFTLEFEVEDIASEFWTDFVAAEERA